MNPFFYEFRGNEKIKQLMAEGLMSQAVHRSGVVKGGLHRNRLKIALVLVGILVSLGLLLLVMAGCAAPASQLPAMEVAATQPPAAQASSTQPPATPALPAQPLASQTTPKAKPDSDIVQEMVDRLNAGDVEGSLAYFSAGAMGYLIGFPPAGIEVYTGKEQLRLLWQDSVSNHFKWDIEVISDSGGIVNVRAKTWHDFTRQLGVAPLEYADVYEVSDGEIITYGSWLTGESLDRFRPAFAEVMPPEPTATPSSDPPVSEITVTIAGGTCTTDSPPALQAGEVRVNLRVKDKDNSLYALTLFTLDPGKDILDLMVSTAGLPPSWGEMLLLEELRPGQSETYTFALEQGPVYLICWSQPPDLPIGNAGPITVVP